MKQTTYTILVVDDSPEDRETYKAYLCEDTDCQYTILEAGNADEAIRICKSVALDCVLLDFELPEVDGLEVMDRLANEEGGIREPIVMITGRGNERIAVQALKRGALDYLVKSEISPQSLFRAVRNAIERAEAGRELEEQRRNNLLTEQELRRSEELLRFLLESVKDYAIVMLDTTGQIVSWNAGARRMFTYHDREIVGKHVRAIFGVDDVKAGRPERLLSEADRRGSVQEDGLFIRRDRESFPGHGVLSSIRDFAGALKGFVLVLQDRSQRGENSALSLTEIKGVLDHIPLACLLVQRSAGEVLHANAAAQEYFGVVPEKLSELFEGIRAGDFDRETESLLSGQKREATKMRKIGDEVFSKAMIASPFPAQNSAYSLVVIVPGEEK